MYKGVHLAKKARDKKEDVRSKDMEIFEKVRKYLYENIGHKQLLANLRPFSRRSPNKQLKQGMMQELLTGKIRLV